VAPRIYGLVLRILRDAHQSEEVTQDVFLELWQTCSVTPFDQTAASAHAALEAQTVRAALSTLSRCHPEALELAYFGGHSYSEVAQLLRIPPGTAKTRIRDGLTLTPGHAVEWEDGAGAARSHGHHLGLVTSQIGKSTPWASGS
jgi:RNA polymerase sigma-70 factor, ECF subfamily